MSQQCFNTLMKSETHLFCLSDEAYGSMCRHDRPFPVRQRMDNPTYPAGPHPIVTNSTQYPDSTPCFSAQSQSPLFLNNIATNFQSDSQKAALVILYYQTNKIWQVLASTNPTEQCSEATLV